MATNRVTGELFSGEKRGVSPIPLDGKAMDADVLFLRQETGQDVPSFTIDECSSGVDREQLRQPFGFKGSSMNEMWQVAVHLRGGDRSATGLAVQGTLWSDAALFTRSNEEAANRLMYRLTRYALTLVQGKSFASPMTMLDEIFPQVEEYAQQQCNESALRQTFILNALVALDNAAWLLYARQNGMTSFDEMIPWEFQTFLPCRHSRIASIPLISYNTTEEEIRNLARKNFFFLKIKIGQPGTQEEMLQRDVERVVEVHRLVGRCETPYTESGHVVYYLDANGRYETRDLLQRFFDQVRPSGAFDRIVLLEEPFPEEQVFDVHDLPVRIAADESTHTVANVLERAELGYGALALKGIAKTLSQTLRMGTVASRRGLPCFCADLTVNPLLLEWNKCLAARLNAFPGLADLGLLESNGEQNYRDWDRMLHYSPCFQASWAHVRNGFWYLDDDYYARSGGIFIPSPHYDQLLSPKRGFDD